MYMDEEAVREEWEAFQRGEITGLQMMDAFDSWDGDPIEVIG